MKTLQKLSYIVLGLALGVTLTTAMPAIAQGIDAMLNTVNIELDGKQIAVKGENFTLADGTQIPYSISYKNTTYLPMRKVGELVGKDIYWDQETQSAGVGKKATVEKPADTSWTAEEEKAYQEFKAMWTVDTTTDYYGNKNSSSQLYMECGVENKTKLYSFCVSRDEESMKKISLRASREFLIANGYDSKRHPDHSLLHYRSEQSSIWSDQIVFRNQNYYSSDGISRYSEEKIERLK